MNVREVLCSRPLERAVRYARNERQRIEPRLVLAPALVECLRPVSLSNLRTQNSRRAGCTGISPNVYIAAPIDLRGAHLVFPGLQIGPHTIINTPCFIDVHAPVQIGARVAIGHHAAIVTSSHRIGPPEQRHGELEARPVTVGDGVWIRCAPDDPAGRDGWRRGGGGGWLGGHRRRAPERHRRRRPGSRRQLAAAGTTQTGGSRC